MLREHWLAGVRGEGVIYTYIYRVVREHCMENGHRSKFCAFI